jgi:hypothetical protein
MTKLPVCKTWDRADRFFLADALARGMSMPEVAAFLNKSEDEVRQRANLNRHRSQSFDSSVDRARESHRYSTANKSMLSAGSGVSLAKRRASAACR